jgi:squalene synthase HpnC
VTPDATRADECRATGSASASAAAIAAGAGAQAPAENFPVALRFLPARYRRHLAAVYGFARSADDMGDEAAAPERLGLLDELEADLDRLYRMVSWAGAPGDGGSGGEGSGGGEGPGGGGAGAAGVGVGGMGVGGMGVGGAGVGGAGVGGAGVGGTGLGGTGLGGTAEAGADRGGPRLSVVRALAPAVVECAIPAQPFRDLIEANRQDQVVSRYQTFGDLLDYCRLSANPVGRIVLHVFGAATPEREALSDQVCTALQLAEHWQDVAEDLRAGRIYLPLEDMDRFGCAERDLAAPRAAPQVRALMAFEDRRARGLLDAGAPLVGTLRGAARAAVAGYVAGGRAALAAIAASGHDVLRATARPAKARVAAELVKAYATGR